MGHQIAKLAKAGRTRHTYKMGSTKNDTVVTLETGGQKQSQAAGSANEFIDCAHLRQVMCLMPAGEMAAAAKDDAESSSDSIDEKSSHKKGNLVPSKKIEAYIKVSKYTQDLKAMPLAANIIRQVKVSVNSLPCLTSWNHPYIESKSGAKVILTVSPRPFSN